MIKIYFNDKPLIIAEKASEELKSYLDSPNTFVSHSTEKNEIEGLIKSLQNPKTIAALLLAEEKAALEAVKEHFVLIQAAGGLVFTNTDKVLLIYRRSKWDLPKGKLDENESLEECAVREVEEETGLQDISIKQPLCITYHTYEQEGQAILMESHWYLMHSGKEQVFSPQLEEDI